jgi:hypothetical protein
MQADPGEDQLDAGSEACVGAEVVVGLLLDGEAVDVPEERVDGDSGLLTRRARRHEAADEVLDEALADLAVRTR